MKINIAAVLFLFILNIYGQNVEEKIKLINNIEEANEYVQTNQAYKGEIIEISPEIEDNKIFSNKIKGEIFSNKNNIYKVLEIKKIKAFKVSYIFLDGNKLQLKSINELRKNILIKYQNGIAFLDLVKEYTMDGNLSGDLGWFTEGMMVAEFENAIKSHKLNEIFTVDVPTEKWYYVTLKNFKEKEIESLTILKINR